MLQVNYSSTSFGEDDGVLWSLTISLRGMSKYVQLHQAFSVDGFRLFRGLSCMLICNSRMPNAFQISFFFFYLCWLSAHFSAEARTLFHREIKLPLSKVQKMKNIYS